jgi:hypothetical protein
VTRVFTTPEGLHTSRSHHLPDTRVTADA